MTSSLIRLWADKEKRFAFVLWLIISLVVAVLSYLMATWWKAGFSLDSVLRNPRWTDGVTAAVSTSIGMIVWGLYWRIRRRAGSKSYYSFFTEVEPRSHFVWGALVVGCVVLICMFLWIPTDAPDRNAPLDFKRFLLQDQGGLFVLMTGAATIIGTYIALQSILELKHTITSFPQLIDRVNNLLKEVKARNESKWGSGGYVAYCAMTPLTGCLMVRSDKIAEMQELLEDKMCCVSMICLEEKEHTKWLLSYDGRLSDLGVLRKEFILKKDEECKHVLSQLILHAKSANRRGIHPVTVSRERLLGYHFFVSNERAIVVSPLFLPLEGAPPEQQKELQSVQTLGFETTDRQIIQWLQRQHEHVWKANACDEAKELLAAGSTMGAGAESKTGVSVTVPPEA